MARNDVHVDVRILIAEDLEVQVDWLVHGFDRFGYDSDLGPERCGPSPFISCGAPT